MGRIGKNEKDFEDLISKKFSKDVLKGKRSFKIEVEEADGLDCSVDQKILLPDGRTILVEIESRNSGSIPAGQYIILNSCCKINHKKNMFLIVHYYVDKKTNKPFNTNRTLRTMGLAKILSGKNHLKGLAVHINDIRRVLKKVKTIEEFANEIWY